MTQHWLGSGIVTTRTSALYQRVYADTGLNRGEPIRVEADVVQDAGVGCTSETCIVWTDETLVTLASLELDCEELVGCEEAIEAAFQSGEREACRVGYVRQRTGERAVA